MLGHYSVGCEAEFAASTSERFQRTGLEDCWPRTGFTMVVVPGFRPVIRGLIALGTYRVVTGSVLISDLEHDIAENQMAMVHRATQPMLEAVNNIADRCRGEDQHKRDTERGKKAVQLEPRRNICALDPNGG